MSVDRRLIEQIKEHFARKSSAQLEQIAGGDEHDDHWSAEAVVAATEVLDDRAIGRATEPACVEEEPPPPPSRHDTASAALLAGLGMIAIPFLGWEVMPDNRADAADPIARDQPVPFGSGIAWLAVETTDTAGVAAALGLRGVRKASWVAGIDAAYRSSVFVTPPLGEWTLVAAAGLLPPREAAQVVKLLVEGLSSRFGEVQYFCTHREAGLYAWARASGGRLVRGYAWLGHEGQTLWDEGTLTRAELNLGLRSDRYPTGTPPDEGSVLELASYWSIDPTTLDEHFKEPAMGLRGRGPWAAAEPRPTA